MTKILILGGTRDAVGLAKSLPDQEGLAVTYSLAGVTVAPVLPDCEVRRGGFGGVDGLRAFLEEERFDALLDATHPYAATMAESAARACEALKLPRLKYLRPAWEPEDGDDWTRVLSAAEAVPHLRDAKRIFLTIGVRGLEPFGELGDAWFLVRFINQPEAPLSLPAHEVLIDRGPFTHEGEMALLKEHRIDALVTKNSGGHLVGAKLTAARALGIPVLMIDRPRLPDGPSVSSEEDVLTWAAGLTPIDQT